VNRAAAPPLTVVILCFLTLGCGAPASEDPLSAAGQTPDARPLFDEALPEADYSATEATTGTLPADGAPGEMADGGLEGTQEQPAPGTSSEGASAAQDAIPSSTATMTAGPEGGGCRLPASTRDRIGRAQIWTQKIEDKRVLEGKRDYVWADHGDAMPGIFTSRYMPYNRDFDRSHTVAWYERHHPDWMVYECDGKTPAHYGSKYAWGGYYTPVDITQLDVRRALLRAHLDAPLRERQYDGVSLDNVSLRNWFDRCGIYRDGKWVQQYDEDDEWDSSFSNAVIAWLRFATRYAHERNLCSTANLKYALTPHRKTYARAAYSVDIVLDERGFYDFRQSGEPTYSDEEWVERMTTLAEIAKHRGLVVIDKPQRKWSQLTPKVVNASIANYLLIKGDHSYLAILAADDHHRFVDFDQLYEDVGDARGAITRAGNLYRRFFRNAIALANPWKDKTAHYTLNTTSRWTYLGKRIRGRVELAPGEARLIMRNGRTTLRSAP
jgi:hypothetical protein